MAKKVSYGAMLIALSLIFSYVEVLIPISFGIPGIKLGLANLVVVLGLHMLKPMQVFWVLVVRIVLSSMMFGSLFSMIYSLTGGILSFFVMLFLKKMCKGFSIIGISMAGGVSHNIGQLVVAACVMENMHVFLYMPVLLIAGMMMGMLIGVLGQRLQKYLEGLKDMM